MTAPQQEAFDLDIEVPAPAAAQDRQWRLAEVQIANWGTLDGRIYRFPVSRRGHLITGPSGSGKSSVLDAIAAVLTPDKWLRFNQAAQGGAERTATRGLVSYVRGAWTRRQDEHEDRVISAYLRPGATWAGVVLTYRTGEGDVVSLGRLFFLRGTAMSRAEMKDLCLLERSAVDLAELQTLIDDGIRTRRVQARWPQAVTTTNGGHGPFYARLRSVFGIRDDAALHLLHRTQSAKGLDSLDQLFRNHMLERPATFAMAERAVEEFGALRTAYERVMDLRRQRDHLLELRAAADEYDTALAETERLRRLEASIHPYQQARVLEETRRELDEVQASLAGFRAARAEADTEHDRAEQRRQHTLMALNSVGGDRIVELERQVEAAREQHRERLARRDVLINRLRAAGVDAQPRTAAEFGELQTIIAADLEAAPEHAGPSHTQLSDLARRRDAVRELEADITALRRGGSTVPRRMASVRDELAEHLGVPPKAVPFAAELLDVDARHQEWTGAIERVLAPLSLTLLVPDRLLAQARAWVDGRHLGVRLRFEEVTQARTTIRPANSQDSLVHKVTVRQGEFHDWLQARLCERFDLACVSNAAELARHERAVTLAGQMKLSATRYEKDDRFRVDDRSRWVLGDPAAKLEVLIGELSANQDAFRVAEEAVQRAQQRADAERQRRATLSGVLETPWTDVDHAELERRIADLTAQVDELSAASTDLDAARRRDEAAQRDLREARESADAARLAVAQAERLRDERTREAQELEAESSGREPVPTDVAVELEARFRAVRRSGARSALSEAADVVRREVSALAERARTAGEQAAQRCTVLTTQFSRQWVSAAADATPGVEDREAYLGILDRILGQGLPEHEDRFHQILHERSAVLFGELHRAISTAPGEIEDRVDPINTALGRFAFDEGRFLHLRVKVRRPEAAQQFLRDLSSVAENAWADDSLDDAERRYNALAQIMDRLASSDHVDRVWRQQCLDTREHVTFLAQEVDDAGAVHATYDSGAAMSGGQQQKLVVFCLAAALRYQLASPEDPRPRYGTVILDEAFDKADARYTRMAMDVFVEFGFQMVLATPQKLLQTIAPYVGGITTVENPTRRLTQIAEVMWEDEG